MVINMEVKRTRIKGGVATNRLHILARWLTKALPESICTDMELSRTWSKEQLCWSLGVEGLYH